MNRFKYGEIVKHDATSGVSNLELTDVTADDVGYYTCRASNDYSAIISAAATVLVEGPYTIAFIQSKFSVFVLSWTRFFYFTVIYTLLLVTDCCTISLSYSG